MDRDCLLAAYIKLAEAKPEAPEWAPFGQFAWGKHREGSPEEENNELESIIYSELKKHFSNKREGLPLITANFLVLLQKIGWYKDVLHPPPQKTLYRGLNFSSKKELAKFLDVEEMELDRLDSLEYKVTKSFPVENGFSTSWTAQKKISKDFSELSKGYSVTLVADVSDNKYRFLAGPGGLYDVEGLCLYHEEKETVGLEPIKVRKVEWQKLKKYQK